MSSSSDLKPPPQPHPPTTTTITLPLPPDPTPPSEPKKSKPTLDPNTVVVPSYSRWFKWDGIHEVEARHLGEFFDGKSKSKTPKTYKYYRNAIIKQLRSNPTPTTKKLTFTEVRRSIVGDVGSIRRVFDFLDTWGLINYSPPSSGKVPLRWEEKESKAAEAEANEKAKKRCSSCKSVCTIACFVSDKFDLVLCARCYVRGNYNKAGTNSSEFRRVEISEQVKTDWTDKETLHLLEAIMHYGDDWKRIAEHVVGRTEKECIARFIKLPFGEQYLESADQGDEDSLSHQLKDETDAESLKEPSNKRQRLTPLADASNPIMAQAAFLSALAGVEVSEAAAQAAVATLYDIDHLSTRGVVQPQGQSTGDQEPTGALNGNPVEARVDAESLLKQEEDEFVKSISNITEVKMKEILDEVSHYEQMELQLERERHQLHQMKHQLFLDQLSFLFHKTAARKPVESVAEEHDTRTELNSTN